MCRHLAIPCAVALLTACPDSSLKNEYASIQFSPVTLDFGNRSAGTSVTLPLKVSNTGRLTLVISNVEIKEDARSAFSVGGLPNSIPPMGEATVMVSYHAPATEGPDGARLVFTSNAQNAQGAQVSLGGHSVVPCSGGQTDCSGVCADTMTDDAHCGSCDNACTGAQHCVNGTCTCMPKTCGTTGCGDFDDGCGNTLHCGPCQGSNMACMDNMCVSCPDQAAFNACGVCAGPTVTGVGDACTASNGCPSTLACNATGDGTVCTEVAKNECGVCGGPGVTGLGASCTSASGCPSMTVCNAAGDGAQCADVAPNACGVCGGPTVMGVGMPCMSASGCPSTYVCNATGDGVVCADVAKNGCGVCAGPIVSGVGSTCMSANGCQSTLVCNATGDGTVCPDVPKNACGLCGGPTVTGLGTTCTASNGCASTMGCNATGDAAVCTDVPKNACNVCNGATVTGIGSSCTTASGCSSTLQCNAAGNGTQCADVTQNACGVCGGPTVSGVGASCTAANGCPGTDACNQAGNGTTCEGPAYCDYANHVVISQLSGYGPMGEYDEFIELYNPTSSSIDLSTYTLWYRAAGYITGHWSKLGLVGGTIAGRSYRLGVFGGPSNTSYAYSGATTADFYYETGGFINIAQSAGQVELRSDANTPPDSPSTSDLGLVDFVGYGAAAVAFGGTAAPGPATNTAGIVRKIAPNSTTASLAVPGGSDLGYGNGYDTDDNGNDFVIRDPRAPNNSKTPAQP